MDFVFFIFCTFWRSRYGLAQKGTYSMTMLRAMSRKTNKGINITSLPDSIKY
jgi:hypothetical protein